MYEEDNKYEMSFDGKDGFVDLKGKRTYIDTRPELTILIEKLGIESEYGFEIDSEEHEIADYERLIVLQQEKIVEQEDKITEVYSDF